MQEKHMTVSWIGHPTEVKHRPTVKQILSVYLIYLFLESRLTDWRSINLNAQGLKQRGSGQASGIDIKSHL
jgi:hypothetical protein